MECIRSHRLVAGYNMGCKEVCLVDVIKSVTYILFNLPSVNAFENRKTAYV